MQSFFFFFFSSRRRHTRCSRDWSSDVCSSDLLGLTAYADVPQILGTVPWVALTGTGAVALTAFAIIHGNDAPAKIAEILDLTRSEEHTSELQSRLHLVCRLLLEKKKTL